MSTRRDLSNDDLLSAYDEAAVESGLAFALRDSLSRRAGESELSSRVVAARNRAAEALRLWEAAALDEWSALERETKRRLAAVR